MLRDTPLAEISFIRGIHCRLSLPPPPPPPPAVMGTEAQMELLWDSGPLERQRLAVPLV